jgi:flavin reductase (DIM6/NTAB) family NADH-FMN oxidoreductase RutF
MYTTQLSKGKVRLAQRDRISALDAAGADRSDSLEAFKQAMALHAAAVCLVTSNDEAGPCGLTATAVMSLTVEPPQLAVSLARSSRTLGVIMGEGRFCVNLASVEQRADAERFASRQHEHDRFANLRWHTLATGAPVLDDAVYNIDCTLARAMSIDTHVLLVGRVAAIRIAPERSPLLYSVRQWGHWEALA